MLSLPQCLLQSMGGSSEPSCQDPVELPLHFPNKHVYTACAALAVSLLIKGILQGLPFLRRTDDPSEELGGRLSALPSPALGQEVVPLMHGQ